MSFTIGRLAMDDPESFPEAVGEGVTRVGATPVPGGRSGLSTSATLTSFTANITDTLTDREGVRRQLRSLLNNLDSRLQAVYVQWSEDPEQDGWYVPGTATFDVAGPGALAVAFWRFTGVELNLVGRPRTHRRAVAAYLRDRRTATQPRDTYRRVYSTDFAAMTPLQLTWLPATVSDVTVTNVTSATITGARTTYGGGLVQAAVGVPDLAVVEFEQDAVYRNLGDAVITDRRGTLTAPTTGPATGWQEVYGPDWQCAAGSDWLDGADTPLLDNGLCRVRYVIATASFAIDRWDGAAWAEQGRVLIQRVGATTGFCDLLMWSKVLEWSHDRAVVRCVMRRAADTNSREEVVVTLQRGWNGPRFEVYPAPLSGGGAAGAGVHLYRNSAPTGTETANKYDASLQTTTGAPNFAAGAVGAATFTGENWIVMRRSGVNALILAGLQAAATGRVESNSTAYGSTRNGIAIRTATGTGYVSAHVGMNVASTTDAIDSVNTLYDGARDLGKEILMDSRSPQTIVGR